MWNFVLLEKLAQTLIRIQGHYRSCYFVQRGLNPFDIVWNKARLLKNNFKSYIWDFDLIRMVVDFYSTQIAFNGWAF